MYQVIETVSVGTSSFDASIPKNKCTATLYLAACRGAFLAFQVPSTRFVFPCLGHLHQLHCLSIICSPITLLSRSLRRQCASYVSSFCLLHQIFPPLFRMWNDEELGPDMSTSPTDGMAEVCP
jgi:hypothetical protein